MKTKEEVDALFEQVKHLIESDEPVEHPWEVHPHEFTKSERAALLAEFPELIDDTNADEFLRRIALAMGIYHRLCESEGRKISNSEARKKFRELKLAALSALDRLPGREAQRALERIRRCRDAQLREHAKELGPRGDASPLGSGQESQRKL